MTTKRIRLRSSSTGFKTPFVGQGISEYYRRLAEAAEQQSKPQPTQTVWAIGSVQWFAEQKKSG
jgi:hypothetical protein